MALARAELESLLRTRRLDRTLTSARPDCHVNDEYAISATGVDALDRCLDGGFPRGQLSELAGPRTSGRMSLLLQWLGVATRRGELVAVIDGLDMLDVASLEAAGVVLDRVLWVRGHVTSNPGFGRELNQRAMEQAIRTMALILQAGNFGLVALDVAEAPLEVIRRLPFTTWLRLQRMIEGSQTAALIVGPMPIARSPAGVTLVLTPGGYREGRTGAWGTTGTIEGRVIRARARVAGDTTTTVPTQVHAHV
ncbi:MAG: hypothetical protein AB7N65_10825 [Vicinamibacterales bacterium]